MRLNKTERARRRQQVWALVPMAGAVTAVAIIEARRFADKNRLLEKPVFVIGKTTRCLAGDRGSGSLVYEFEVSGKMYSDIASYGNIIVPRAANMITRPALVVYEKSNPGNSELLFTPGDYAGFGLRFPDSLQWRRYYFRVWQREQAP